ncbi:cupin-like domain-containing protein [Paracraurococcus lichenis]|uniref:Cupin-like domain-containing protein n=1 Tax=Paracraurococcus lichenis TaxID=3064888 RepID=A0ABT9E8R6_9PROT|nr:cupin-like domain-containing protein [Paracraurococcus sp. LOR1-02]MDO9712578.1 cupin-like domain-containing protein [Paracraurococcus sp. LOR1-02]
MSATPDCYSPSGLLRPRFDWSNEEFTAKYNLAPYGFTHNLHRLDLFEHWSLRDLCRRYSQTPADFYVSRSAPTPGTPFYAMPAAGLTPEAAFDQIPGGSYKILLKRLEQHDQRFRDLLDCLVAQIRERLRDSNNDDDFVRLESAVFISAPQATTPFHFDPEVNFFSQIEGEKIYHLYPPADLGEAEVEPLYARAEIDIGQVDLARRTPAAERIFHLRPGSGLHQPQDAPHWVETVGTRSISYSIVYETRQSRRLGRVRALNHYLRRLHVEPVLPGRNGRLDSMKAAAMAALLPIGKPVHRALHKALRR